MLYLVTGLPGAGKTLHAVSKIAKEKAFEGRTVFYSGIKDLKLPWHELDKPEDWVTVPDNAVVVIDEAQRFMRVRAPGAAVPKHIEALETHRHRGLDIVILTQHPNLLDTNVRRLVGHHRHLRRTWGMLTSKVFQWDRVGDPESRTDLTEANQSRWQYDKAAFGLYHSAETHTHKVRLPNRVWFAAALLLFVGVTIFMLGRWADKKINAKPGELVPAIAPASSAGSNGKARAPTTYTEWAEERRPVAPEDVASSVRYYPLTQPTRAPRVAGCIRSAQRCQCFTQQATIVKTSELQCAEIMANLRFQDWGPGGDSGFGDPPPQTVALPGTQEPQSSAGAGATGARPAAAQGPATQPSPGPK